MQGTNGQMQHLQLCDDPPTDMVLVIVILNVAFGLLKALDLKQEAVVKLFVLGDVIPIGG